MKPLRKREARRPIAITMALSQSGTYVGYLKRGGPHFASRNGSSSSVNDGLSTLDPFTSVLHYRPADSASPLDRTMVGLDDGHAWSTIRRNRWTRETSHCGLQVLKLHLDGRIEVWRNGEKGDWSLANAWSILTGVKKSIRSVSGTFDGTEWKFACHLEPATFLRLSTDVEDWKWIREENR